jgi:DNA-binding beta-propeller fold protein YncE
MRYLTKQFLILTAIAFLVLSSATAKAQPVRGRFLYNLSSFTGTIRYNWVRTFVDKENNEIYVSNGADRSVRIFNESGMEIYNFGDDASLGNISDGAVERDANILLLSYFRKEPNYEPIYAIIRCNYRGEPISRIEIKNLPTEFSDLLPNRIVLVGEQLYLADLSGMKVAVIDMTGQFKNGYDIASILDLDKQQRADSGITGFNVDKKGNILFTISVHFKAYVLSPDGKITSFGKKGSGPGRFGIVAGISSDDKGYYYVADTLRCVVMIFDQEFRFQSEFGYRGLRPGNLIAPRDLETDDKDRVYVTQSRNRGVSVFQVKYD